MDLEVVLRSRALGELFDSGIDNVLVFDLDERCVAANQALAAMLGATADDLTSLSLSELVAPEDLVTSRDHFADAARGTVRRYLSRILSRSGDALDVEVTLLPLRTDDDDVVGVVGIVRDLTQLRLVHEQLQMNLSISQLAGRLARFAGWSLQATTLDLLWSDELFRLVGLSRENAPTFEESLVLIDEPARFRVREAIERCLKYGEPVNLEFPVTSVADETVFVQMMGEAVRDETGHIVRLDGLVHDVTSIVAERERSTQIEVRLADTIELIAMPIFMVGRDGCVGYANVAGCDLVGADSASVLGRLMSDVLGARDAGAISAMVQRAADEGVVDSTTIYLGGSGKWCLLTAYAVADGIVVTAQDMTEQLNARREMDASIKRADYLANMLEMARDAMLVRDLNSGISYWNGAAEALYGWTAEEVMGRDPLVLLYDDATFARQAIAQVFRDGFWMGEIEQRTKDGQPIFVEARWQLVLDEGGNPTSLFAVNTDVTDRRREMEGLIRNQRMESLGTLAGGIAHDLNNVFTPMMMALEILLRHDHDEGHRELLLSMERSVNRGADMIRQVLSFARGVGGQRRPFEAKDLLRDVLQFCSETLPKNIDVVVEASPDLPVVIGDITQITQVLINLITNARDAMPEGGRLVIRASTKKLTGKYIRPSAKTLHGRFLVVEVTDTGSGMKHEILGRIYEPFFTTKDVGQGTGLGLSTSRAIVLSHGGTIDVDSVEGFGSRFEVYLPASATSRVVAAPSEDDESKGTQLGGRRVLVVDDEESIVSLLQVVLGSEGFDVSVARDGQQALRVAHEANGEFDLVISDVNMPKIDGRELVRTLRERWSELPIIVVSGLVDDRIPDDELWSKDVRFLAKPFSVADLMRTISQVMHGPG